MHRTALLLLSPLLLFSTVSSAQLLGRPNPCVIRIIVSYEDGQQKVRDADIELMDSVGGSSMMDRQKTNSDGRVEFNSYTGDHRIRITSPTTYPYEGDIIVQPGARSHVEPIRLRRKPDSNAPVSGDNTKNLANLQRLNVPENARKKFEAASAAVQKQEWQQARKDFEAAVRDYPDYDLAYNGLGLVYTRLGKKAEAEQSFRKAFAVNDKFAEAQRNLARILLGDHNYAEAAQLLNRSLATDPANAWALTNAAYSELQLRQFDKAAEHALRVHELPHQGFTNAHVIAGYALDALGKHEAALGQWELYLKEDPTGPNAAKAKAEVARLSNKGGN
jgi:tetratricopeptide (TPR) repeat protein